VIQPPLLVIAHQLADRVRARATPEAT